MIVDLNRCGTQSLALRCRSALLVWRGKSSNLTVQSLSHTVRMACPTYEGRGGLPRPIAYPKLITLDEVKG